MSTLLDCIRRVAPQAESLISSYPARMQPLAQRITSGKIRELVLVGSGTSHTAAVTARGSMERLSGLRTSCLLPNELLHNSWVLPQDAAYLFFSQSGTSILTLEALRKIQETGALTIAVSESEETPLAKASQLFLDMGCGQEEIGMRTIGYCTSVLTGILLALAIGQSRGRCSANQVQQQLQLLHTTISQQRKATEATLGWFDRNREALLNSETFVLYGGGSLYGVALEGALKILEVSQNKMAVGYESDDGMHGPTLGFTQKTCVIALNDGGIHEERCRQLIRWAKQEKRNGYLFGQNGWDAADHIFDCSCETFGFLPFAAAVEVLAYRLAVDSGVNYLDRSMHHEKEYFVTHRE